MIFEHIFLHSGIIIYERSEEKHNGFHRVHARTEKLCSMNRGAEQKLPVPHSQAMIFMPINFELIK